MHVLIHSIGRYHVRYFCLVVRSGTVRNTDHRHLVSSYPSACYEARPETYTDLCPPDTTQVPLDLSTLNSKPPLGLCPGGVAASLLVTALARPLPSIAYHKQAERARNLFIDREALVLPKTNLTQPGDQQHTQKDCGYCFQTIFKDGHFCTRDKDIILMILKDVSSFDRN